MEAPVATPNGAARPVPWHRRIYYGWVILGTVSLTEVVSWGILYYAFAVFITPMHTDLGWSQVTLTGAFSLALLMSGVAALPVGRWIDRHGTRALMTIGAILGSLLLVAWSLVHEIWLFYLIFAGIGVITAAVLYEPAFAIVATWFQRQRGRALTILTFCGAWASFIFIPLSAWLVETLGWRQALLALAGILAAATILPHGLVLRRRPQDLGMLPDGAHTPITGSVAAASAEHSLTPTMALRDSGFWWLSLGFAISTYSSVALTVHLIPYLVERGHSAGFAATVARLFGLMSLAGRMLIGPLGDRYARRLIATALLGMQFAGLLVLVLTPTVIGALVYVALFGAGAGTMTIMRAAILAERYGAASYGTISGLQQSVLTAAKTFAPLGAGLIAMLLGGYSGLLWALAALTLLGALALLRVADH